MDTIPHSQMLDLKDEPLQSSNLHHHLLGHDKCLQCDQCCAKCRLSIHSLNPHTYLESRYCSLHFVDKNIRTLKHRMLCICPNHTASDWNQVAWFWASLVAQLVKNPPAMWETWVQSLGWEDPLEKGKATHSSTLAWRIPWTA